MDEESTVFNMLFPHFVQLLYSCVCIFSLIISFVLYRKTIHMIFLGISFLRDISIPLRHTQE